MTVEEVLDAACACDLNEGEHGELIEEYINDASDILYVLSGGRVSGRCVRQVYPFRDVNTCGPRPLLWGGYGNWGSSWGIGRHGESWMDWDGVDSIPLRGPHTTIIEVTIDGAVIDPSTYGLLNGNKLFRRGGAAWPNSNNVTLADTEVGTFTITYRFGEAANMSKKRAAIELVCSMVKGDKNTLSRLRGVVSANIQGVAVTMADNEIDALGLPEVSRFMDIYGNSGLGNVGVWAPETNHAWHLVTVAGGSGS